MNKDQQLIEVSQRLLAELMLNFPKGASEESDEALAACVASYISLRSKQQGHKAEFSRREFMENVKLWMEAIDE